MDLICKNQLSILVPTTMFLRSQTMTTEHTIYNLVGYRRLKNITILIKHTIGLASSSDSPLRARARE